MMGHKIKIQIAKHIKLHLTHCIRIVIYWIQLIFLLRTLRYSHKYFSETDDHEYSLAA